MSVWVLTEYYFDGCDGFESLHSIYKTPELANTALDALNAANNNERRSYNVSEYEVIG